MKREELLGVWRLLGVSNGGRPVHTGKTHVVVRDEELWEVWPDSKYFEGEPGPECAYQLTEGDPARLEVRVPNGKFCYLVARDGDRLRMRLGGVFGHFPKSIDDESGSLSEYERVTGEEAQGLRQPPPRIRRRTESHARLGELVYDDNLRWWTTSARLGGEPIRFRVTVAPGTETTAAFDAAASILDRLDHESLRAHAASRLLDLHNDSWRDDDDGPPIDAATFAARLEPESVSVDADGSVTVWFGDDNLFWGHIVHVDLDPKLRPVDAGIAG